MNYKISILHNMARSGGTLISKCLGCMENVVLLSEVHPRVMDGIFNPLKQAEQWHKLFRKDDLWHIHNQPDISWIQAIELIYRRSLQAGKHLLLRDWSHIDFTAVPWVDKPSYTLTIASELGKYFHINNTCTVRHPIDQWISLSNLSIISGKIDISTFLNGYRKFAEIAAETGFIRYEDFTQNPDQSLKVLCERLNIIYDKTYQQKWFDFTHVTGDTSNTGSGRGSKHKEIIVLKRRMPDASTLKLFKKNKDFKTSIKLLGYDF